jgi:hypothetical protein
VAVNNWVQWIVTNHLGDMASICGLFITILGFIVTLVIVYKSKQAATAAKEAVFRVREDIARMDIVAEFASAITHIDEIKRLQRDEAWAVLPDRYSSLRRSLITIKSSKLNTLICRISVIQSAIQQLKSIEDIIEKSLISSSGVSKPNIPKWNNILSGINDSLKELLEIVKAEIGR